jgi:polyferredoxin
LGKLKRKLIQLITTIVYNINIKGFFTGKIYTGNLKNGCVPGLNCYSCPGSTGSCPIGAMQAVLAHYKYKFSFYIFGFLMLIGAFFGRFVCGYLCPFGFFQELMYKIKSKKYKISRKFVYIKYVILIVFVIGLPLFYTNSVGLGDPTFCKYICPAGTLEAGIPLVLLNKPLQGVIGWLFGWKLFILLVVIISSIFTFRPFCKVICPLGAIYSLFNKVSVFRYAFDEAKCIHCNKCVETCKMDVLPHLQVNDIECIRCHECIDVCPTGALTQLIGLGDEMKNEKVN